MTEQRRIQSKGPAAPRKGKLHTGARTKVATAKAIAKTAVRVSPTTRRVGRQIIVDRRDVLREFADR